MNLKQNLREKILAERKKFNEYEFHAENELIIKNVNVIVKSLYKDFTIEEKKGVKFTTQDLETSNTEQVLGLYLPIKGEPDLTKIMLYNNWVFGLPKIEDNRMKFVHYQVGAKLEKKEKAIMQPISDTQVNPNIIIAPALAYSQKGYRLGFGSGHYDRYFSQRTESDDKSIVKIGVCFSKYLIEFLPNENHDIIFNYIVTDEVILKL
ncbi:MAG: 5-formyltetrahydrofolate cyclo-ligase [Rickettsiaceae bacterium]